MILIDVWSIVFMSQAPRITLVTYSIPVLNRRIVMSYAIVGFGPVGQALARAFARKNIEVAIASRRPPQALAPQAQAIGSTVVPKTLREAIKADMIILAVPFWEHREVRKLWRAGRARRSSTR